MDVDMRNRMLGIGRSLGLARQGERARAALPVFRPLPGLMRPPRGAAMRRPA
jgi:hypothetical protein